MSMQHQQRKRGGSFRDCYVSDVASVCVWSTSDEPSEATDIRRSPTLPARGQCLLPPKDARFEGKITVVLDLDETLVYARDGPLYVRPGVDALMSFLAEKCETVVWTSSIHRYADAVVAHIDKAHAVQHTIYRHSSWQQANSLKDLRLLGRPLDSTIIIENTPDCIRGFEGNGVVVADYDGGELEDQTLSSLLTLLRDLVTRHEEGVTVPEYLRACGHVERRELPSDKGPAVQCHCLVVSEEDVCPSHCRPAWRADRSACAAVRAFPPPRPYGKQTPAPRPRRKLMMVNHF